MPWLPSGSYATLSLTKPRVRLLVVELGSHKPCCMVKKKGTELGTEYPSSKRQQRVTRRCAGGSQGYLSQKENGQEKTILRGDTEAQGWGEREPCRDLGSGPHTKGNARARAAHWAETSAARERERGGGGGEHGGAHRADPVQPRGPRSRRLYLL